MKASSLTRHLLAATLFPLLGVAAGWSQTNTKEEATKLPVDLPPKTMDAARGGPSATAATLERVVRTAVASEPTLLRHYDLNQNGTLDDDEWRVAKLSIGGALAGNVGLNPARGEEQRRLDAVADEVARRRALREKTGETFETAKANPAAETKRLETVADEIEERRKQREKIGSGQLPPQTQLERTEQEAKLLVKELLEIGMAQRRAYEEARARAADEQKKKAEAEAKK